MIEVNNLTTNQIDKEFLKKVAKKVLIGENKERLELSIVLVGQAKIRKLNKKYRKKNRVTDVLAFGKSQEFPAMPESGLGLGEVVICFREVQKNAKKFDSSLEKELATCLIHGILHLLGYDHEKNEAEARKMEEKQKYYLELCLKVISLSV